MKKAHQMRKVVLAAVLAIVVCCGTVLSANAAGNKYDINGDGIVSIQDVSLLLVRMATGSEETDINGDGIMSIGDVSALLTYLANPEEEEPDTTPVIDLDGRVETDAASFGGTALVKFVPAESGEYYCFSDANGDTVGYLYDADMQELCSNDDAEPGETNFMLSYSFIGGETYYIGVRYYDATAEGSITVKVAKEYTGNHDFEEGVVTDPTCTDWGYTVYHCTTCGGDFYRDYTDCLGHTQGDALSVIEPDCEFSGFTVYQCTVCGETYEDDFVEPLGHRGEKLRTEEPTCTDAGCSYYLCEVCGQEYVDDFVWPEGHKGILLETVEPTCTEDGYSTYHCTVCDEDYIDDYMWALGHAYADGCCTRCGHTVPAIHAGDTMTAQIENFGEQAMFVFTPEEDGVYCFFSTSDSVNTFAFLYDAEMNMLGMDDDGGENENFAIRYYFLAGETYYFGAKLLWDEPGSFNVQLIAE